MAEKTHCKGSHISQRKLEHSFSSRTWTNQNPWRRSGTENVHFDTCPPTWKRRSSRFPGRTWRVSTTPTSSRLITWSRWSTKWFLVHFWGLHSYTGITLNQAEKNNFLFHWNFWRQQSYSYNLGCNARKPHRRLLEHRWVKRLVWFLDRFHSVHSVKWENSRRIYVVREETDKKAANIQARSFMARTLEKNVKEC